jgi:hypothetical protein
MGEKRWLLESDPRPLVHLDIIKTEVSRPMGGQIIEEA